MTQAVWSGAWVVEHAGVEVVARDDTPLENLIGLAVRRNPKRLHLVVSRVLAKHVPVPPSVARAAGDELGARVEAALDGVPADLVFGYAETATGLGHLVADRVGALAIHSTRRPGWSALSFEEEHSHATTHRLQPHDLALLKGSGPIVLVDDEVTTGQTILNTVRELHAISPRSRYVVAALVDLRPDAARAAAEEVAAELDTSIRFVSLLDGETRHLREPDDVVRAALAATDDGAAPTAPSGDEVVVEGHWPTGVPDGGRHGLPPRLPAFERAVAAVSTAVTPHLVGERVHVLGTEELMYLPLRLAELVEAAGFETTLSSTTRSPVLVVDDPGYAVRDAIRFDAHDSEDDVPRFAYNLTPGRFDTIVVVFDAATPLTSALDLRAALAARCRRVVAVWVGEEDE